MLNKLYIMHYFSSVGKNILALTKSSTIPPPPPPPPTPPPPPHQKEKLTWSFPIYFQQTERNLPFWNFNDVKNTLYVIKEVGCNQQKQ